MADLNKLFLGWNLGTSRIIYKVLTYILVRWDLCDLAEKCRYYLESESERARIADCGNRALWEFHQTHAFIDRFAQLLAWPGLPARPKHDARESGITDG